MIDNSSADLNIFDVGVITALESLLERVQVNYCHFSETPDFATVSKGHGRAGLQASLTRFWNTFYDYESLVSYASCDAQPAGP